MRNGSVEIRNYTIVYGVGDTAVFYEDIENNICGYNNITGVDFGVIDNVVGCMSEIIRTNGRIVELRLHIDSLVKNISILNTYGHNVDTTDHILKLLKFN